MKAVDIDTDETVAFARWNIYEVERPESEWELIQPGNWDVGTNVEAANDFYNVCSEAKQKLTNGTSHCYKSELS